MNSKQSKFFWTTGHDCYMFNNRYKKDETEFVDGYRIKRDGSLAGSLATIRASMVHPDSREFLGV